MAKELVEASSPVIELEVGTGAVYVMSIVPLRPASVTVIVVEPTPTGITPAVPQIVPTAVLEDDQVAPVLVACEVPFE